MQYISTPQLADAHTYKGEALYKLGRYGEALAAHEEAIHLDPQLARAHRNKGVVLQSLERHGEALAAFEEAIRLDSQDATAHYNKGVVLQSLGRDGREVLAAFEEAIRLNSGHADAHNNKGNVLCDLKCYREALAAFNEAIRINPESADYRYNKGNALFRLKCYEEAVEAYEETTRRNPEHAEAHHNRCVALSNLIGELKQHTRRNPEDASAHFKLGNAFARLEYYRDAADAYDEVLRIDPGHAEARDNRRTALDNLVRECEQFILSNPVRAYFDMGNAFARLGHDKDAAIAYMQVLNINQWHAGANNNIGVVIDNLQQRARSGDAGARADLQALGINPDRGPEESVRGEDAPVIQNLKGVITLK